MVFTRISWILFDWEFNGIYGMFMGHLWDTPNNIWKRGI